MPSTSKPFSSTNRFIAGGALPVGYPMYISRPADQALYNSLRAGELCYILNSRQMGKSSLLFQTAERLRKDGFTCIYIDASLLGTHEVSIEKWFLGILRIISNSLELSTEIQDWWAARNGVSFGLRMQEYLSEVVLSHHNKPIVIFFDEIDSILSLTVDRFEIDDFFATIRSMYNANFGNASPVRLNFAIIGVASANDLMSNPERTPFNVGSSIDLEGFTFESSQPLLEGFRNQEVNSNRLLERILWWTNGHPYLTLKLCKSIVENETRIDQIELVVKSHVQRLFLETGSLGKESNLSNVNLRITRDEKHNVRMLYLYRQIMSEKSVTTDPKDDTQIHLKLSGLVREQQGTLVIANRIYKAAFDDRWLTGALEIVDRPFKKNVDDWLKSNKDPSFALRGKQLEAALSWASKRDDLNQFERQFFDVSRQEESRWKDQELKHLTAENERAEAEKRRIEAENKAAQALRQQKELLETGKKRIRITIGAVLISIFLLCLSLYAWIKGNEAEKAKEKEAEQRVIAEKNAINAQENARKAKEQETRAIEQAEEAAKQKGLALEAARLAAENEKVAQKKEEIAKELTREAEELKTLAETTAKLAKEKEIEAQEQRKIAISEAKNAAIQKELAEEAAMQKETEKNIAKEQKERADKLGNMAKMTSRALQLLRDEPVQAIRQAKMVWELRNDLTYQSDTEAETFKIVDDAIYKIYREFNFYLSKQLGEFNGHQRPIPSLKIAHNNTFSLSGSNDGKIFKWEFEKDHPTEPIFQFTAPVREIAISPDDKWLVVRIYDESIKLCDIEKKIEKYSLDSQYDAIRSLTLSPSSGAMFTASENGFIQRWGYEGGLVRTFARQAKLNGLITVAEKVEIFAIVLDDYSVNLWDPGTDTLGTELSKHSAQVSAVDFSPDGRHMISCSIDGTAIISDTSGKPQTKIELSHNSVVLCATSTPDNKHFVTGCKDGTAWLWNTGGYCLRIYKADDNPIRAVDVSSDGKFFVSGSKDGTVRKWEMVESLEEFFRKMESTHTNQGSDEGK